ncbi:MAG: hypothetical protein QM751_12965 [Paludibacteraceae bacterium]
MSKKTNNIILPVALIIGAFILFKKKKSTSNTTNTALSKDDFLKHNPTDSETVLNTGTLERGISGLDNLTKAQKTWLERMGTSTYVLAEPYGSLWQAKGKKVYIQLKERNILSNFNNAKHRLEQLDFIDKVYEAGGDNIILVILK